MRSWLAALLVLAAFPNAAFAYRTFTDLPELEAAHGHPVAWESFPIDFEVYEDDEAPADTDATLAALGRAAARWNAVSCMRGAFGEASATDLAGSNDGYNTLQWVHSGWSAIGDATAIATTEPIYDIIGGRYVLVEADIFLNADTVSWSDDLVSHLDGVLTHELGHVIGLAHPCEPDGAGGAPLCDDSAMTMMNPLYDPARAALTRDDRAGACFLYPDGTQPDDAEGAGDSSAGCNVLGGSARHPSCTASLAALLFVAAFVARRRARRLC